MCHLWTNNRLFILITDTVGTNVPRRVIVRYAIVHYLHMMRYIQSHYCVTQRGDMCSISPDTAARSVLVKSSQFTATDQARQAIALRNGAPKWQSDRAKQSLLSCKGNFISLRRLWMLQERSESFTYFFGECKC